MCAIFKSTDHSPRLLKSPLHCAITLKSHSDPRILGPTPDFWDSFCQIQVSGCTGKHNTAELEREKGGGWWEQWCSLVTLCHSQPCAPAGKGAVLSQERGYMR